MSEAGGHRCGTVVLAGRPNVGKSTLLNALVGQKLSIVTPKAQTTRQRIAGVLTRPGFQLILQDTPGFGAPAGRRLNQAMHREAVAAIATADVAILITAAGRWTVEDDAVLAQLAAAGTPIVVAVNKIDRVRPKDRLLPYLERLSGRHAFAAIVPVSALRGENLARLVDAVVALLPVVPALYPESQVTDRNERFMAAEVVREKLMLALHDELPYGIAVEIERFGETPDGRVEIDAIIWVEREGQRKIVIGSRGEGLKAIGRAARMELNELLGRRVHLSTWVKLRKDWTDDAGMLRRLGH
ncbi:MAG: GTPase Era, partial [Steroidobacteraceae bacterium]